MRMIIVMMLMVAVMAKCVVGFAVVADNPVDFPVFAKSLQDTIDRYTV
jgi:hypothetical protein